MMTSHNMQCYVSQISDTLYLLAFGYLIDFFEMCFDYAYAISISHSPSALLKNKQTNKTSDYAP